MDLSDVPFDVPVILQSRDTYEDRPPYYLSLTNVVGTNRAWCVGERHDKYVWMELRRTAAGNVAIWSMRSGRFLNFDQQGNCYFKAESIEDGAAFELKAGSEGGVVFVPKGTDKCFDVAYDGAIMMRDSGLLVDWSLVSPSSSPEVVAGLAAIDSSLKALECSLGSVHEALSRIESV